MSQQPHSVGQRFVDWVDWLREIDRDTAVVFPQVGWMRRDSIPCLLAPQPTRAAIHRIPAPGFALWWIALRLSTLQRVDSVNFVDVAGAELLAREADSRRRNGGGFYLVALSPGACAPLTQGEYFREIGAETTFVGKTEAVASIVPELDPEVCRRCTVRLFRECALQPRSSDHP